MNNVELNINNNIFLVFKYITDNQIINIHNNDINVINYDYLEITIRDNISIEDLLNITKLCKKNDIIFKTDIGPNTNSENKLIFKNPKKNSKKNKNNDDDNDDNNNSKIFFAITLLVILYMIIYN